MSRLRLASASCDVLDECQHAAEVEPLALDRGGVEQRSLGRGEQVEPGGQQRVQGGRQTRRPFALGHVHGQLLEEERVAAGARRDRRPL